MLDVNNFDEDKDKAIVFKDGSSLILCDYDDYYETWKYREPLNMKPKFKNKKDKI